jgi:preprotein translocase subunit SecD
MQRRRAACIRPTLPPPRGQPPSARKPDMNRYPLWKYLLLAFALVVGLVYTLPNFYGEAPAVQVSSGKPTLKVDLAMVGRVEQALKAAGIQADFVQFDGNSVKARFVDTDTQIKAKDALTRALNPTPGDASYIIALNLLSRTPQWLSHLRVLIAEPKPMYLGLDLRGGVHFLMQVDMQAALTKRAESTAGEVRTLLRDKRIQYSGIGRNGTTIEIQFRDEAIREAARSLLLDAQQDMAWTNEGLPGGDLVLRGTLKPESLLKVQEAALKQNITTLHNRVNELGVSEPVIQQQGLDRVVVQLPGVQDTARAKDIIGRTATL